MYPSVSRSLSRSLYICTRLYISGSPRLLTTPCFVRRARRAKHPGLTRSQKVSCDKRSGRSSTLYISGSMCDIKESKRLVRSRRARRVYYKTSLELSIIHNSLFRQARPPRGQAIGRRRRCRAVISGREKHPI